MNTLTIEEPSLIGSRFDRERLESKTTGRILVVSDSHGEWELLERIIGDFGYDCDALVFCGDGMEDIVACLEEASGNEKLREALPPLVACVRGNNDAESFELDLATVEDQPETAATIQLYAASMVGFRLAGRTIMVTHGHRYMVNSSTEALHSVAETMNADLVFFGHTHLPYREEAGATLLLNPGSCSYPRGGNPPTFAVVSFPGSTERYHTEFYEIKKTLFGGWDFKPFHAY